MSQFFISCKESKIENNRSFYGCFHLGPFEPSQSITIANALRRTLLSELYGLSIVSVEIEGATHEYSNLNGVKDSVLDILLNLKEIIFKKDSNSSAIPFLTQGLLGKPQIGYLKARGPGLIRALNLNLPPFIQCVDPDQYIATLAEDGFLNMKFVIQYANKWTSALSGGLKYKGSDYLAPFTFFALPILPLRVRSRKEDGKKAQNEMANNEHHVPSILQWDIFDPTGRMSHPTGSKRSTKWGKLPYRIPSFSSQCPSLRQMLPYSFFLPSSHPYGEVPWIGEDAEKITRKKFAKFAKLPSSLLLIRRRSKEKKEHSNPYGEYECPITRINMPGSLREAKNIPLGCLSAFKKNKVPSPFFFASSAPSSSSPPSSSPPSSSPPSSLLRRNKEEKKKKEQKEKNIFKRGERARKKGNRCFSCYGTPPSLQISHPAGSKKKEVICQVRMILPFGNSGFISLPPTGKKQERRGLSVKLYQGFFFLTFISLPSLLNLRRNKMEKSKKDKGKTNEDSFSFSTLAGVPKQGIHPLNFASKTVPTKSSYFATRRVMLRIRAMEPFPFFLSYSSFFSSFLFLRRFSREKGGEEGAGIGKQKGTPSSLLLLRRFATQEKRFFFCFFSSCSFGERAEGAKNRNKKQQLRSSQKGKTVPARFFVAYPASFLLRFPIEDRKEQATIMSKKKKDSPGTVARGQPYPDCLSLLSRKNYGIYFFLLDIHALRRQPGYYVNSNPASKSSFWIKKGVVSYSCSFSSFILAESSSPCRRYARKKISFLLLLLLRSRRSKEQGEEGAGKKLRNKKEQKNKIFPSSKKAGCGSPGATAPGRESLSPQCTSRGGDFSLLPVGWDMGKNNPPPGKSPGLKARRFLWGEGNDTSARRGQDREMGPEAEKKGGQTLFAQQERLNFSIFQNSNPLTIESIFNPITKVNYIIEVNDYKTTQTSFETASETLELLKILNNFSYAKTPQVKNTALDLPDFCTPHLVIKQKARIFELWKKDTTGPEVALALHPEGKYAGTISLHPDGSYMKYKSLSALSLLRGFLLLRNLYSCAARRRRRFLPFGLRSRNKIEGRNRPCISPTLRVAIKKESGRSHPAQGCYGTWEKAYAKQNRPGLTFLLLLRRFATQEKRFFFCFAKSWNMMERSKKEKLPSSLLCRNNKANEEKAPDRPHPVPTGPANVASRLHLPSYSCSFFSLLLLIPVPSSKIPKEEKKQGRFRRGRRSKNEGGEEAGQKEVFHSVRLPDSFFLSSSCFFSSFLFLFLRRRSREEGGEEAGIGPKKKDRQTFFKKSRLCYFSSLLLRRRSKNEGGEVAKKIGTIYDSSLSFVSPSAPRLPHPIEKTDFSIGARKREHLTYNSFIRGFEYLLSSLRSKSDQDKTLALTPLRGEITKHNIIFEVWTNGSIHPRDAIYEGFKNLVKLFSKLNKINTFIVDRTTEYDPFN